VEKLSSFKLLDATVHRVLFLPLYKSQDHSRQQRVNAQRQVAMR